MVLSGQIRALGLDSNKPPIRDSSDKGKGRQRRQTLIKHNANTISFAPCDMARTVPVLDSNYQIEIIRNAELTCNLKAGSAFRDIANSAGNSAAVVERNRSEFQDPVSRDFPAF
jgi:hypothetical protein